MSDVKRVVVVGGNAAGLSAASYIKRRRPEIETVVFERSRHVSYAACGLPYYVERLVAAPTELTALSLEALRNERGIDVRINHEVEYVDTRTGSVLVRDLASGRRQEVGWDRLVLSTGASPVRPPVAGVELEGVFVLHTLADGIELERYVEDAAPRRVVIVGGGYVGLEMAEAFGERGLAVTLIQRGERVLGNFDPEFSEKVHEKLTEKGVELVLEAELDRLEGNGRVRAVVAGGRRFEADLVLLATGIRPNAELARRAGIELGPTGAIRVDRRMETSVEGVYACGDCAETYHRVLERNVWIPLGDTANKQGRVAGANIVGERLEFPGVVGTAATKVFDLELARTGLSETQARAEGVEVKSSTVKALTRAHYYPGHKPIWIKLVAEKKTNRLLGAQGAGGEGVPKRVDVLATAIWNGMTVDEVAWLDLAYAPPFSPVWDPVLVAAQVARKKPR